MSENNDSGPVGCADVSPSNLIKRSYVCVCVCVVAIEIRETQTALNKMLCVCMASIDESLRVKVRVCESL